MVEFLASWFCVQENKKKVSPVIHRFHTDPKQKIKLVHISKKSFNSVSLRFSATSIWFSRSCKQRQNKTYDEWSKIIDLSFKSLLGYWSCIFFSLKLIRNGCLHLLILKTDSLYHNIRLISENKLILYNTSLKVIISHFKKKKFSHRTPMISINSEKNIQIYNYFIHLPTFISSNFKCINIIILTLRI